MCFGNGIQPTFWGWKGEGCYTDDRQAERVETELHIGCIVKCFLVAVGMFSVDMIGLGESSTG